MGNYVKIASFRAKQGRTYALKDNNIKKYKNIKIQQYNRSYSTISIFVLLLL